jgi:TonB family protein
MPLPHKPVKKHNRLFAALLVSLGIHLLLLPFIAKDAVFHLPAKRPRLVVGLTPSPNSPVQHAQQGLPSNTPSSGHSVSPDLQPRLPPPIADAEKQKPPEKIDGQVVSLGQPKDERPPDKPTHYLSEHDSRVLKETRARETSPFFKNQLSKVQREGKDARQASKNAAAAPSAVRSGENGGTQARDARVAPQTPKQTRQDRVQIQEGANPTVQNRDAHDAVDGEGRKLALAQPGHTEEADSGSPGIPGLAPGAPGTKRGPLTLTLDRPGDFIGKVSGGPMNDHLEGIDEGDETLLSSRAFKYAGYLNRVKETVARIWVPAVEDQAQRHDPSGHMYSFKDRRTIVEYTLDRAGDIKDVHIAVSSGVDYLDRVAVDSFRRAQRFPNPPPGLFDETGTAKLGFAFTLLAAPDGMRMSFGPAYLPNSPAMRGF